MTIFSTRARFTSDIEALKIKLEGGFDSEVVEVSKASGKEEEESFFQDKLETNSR